MKNVPKTTDELKSVLQAQELKTVSKKSKSLTPPSKKSKDDVQSDQTKITTPPQTPSKTDAELVRKQAALAKKQEKKSANELLMTERKLRVKASIEKRHNNINELKQTIIDKQNSLKAKTVQINFISDDFQKNENRLHQKFVRVENNRLSTIQHVKSTIEKLTKKLDSLQSDHIKWHKNRETDKIKRKHRFDKTIKAKESSITKATKGVNRIQRMADQLTNKQVKAVANFVSKYETITDSFANEYIQKPVEQTKTKHVKPQVATVEYL